MILNDELENQLASCEGVAYAKVLGDGYHYQVIIVSDAFLNKSKVARQQWVYSRINEHIASGSLHALTMQTFTNDEWEKKNG